MSGVNKVILVGHLGQKPELRYTSSGVPVANFSLATTERLGKDDAGNKREHTEWHRLVAWRKLAEICAQWLDKGSQIYVEGRLRTSSWQTPEGEKRFKTEIHIDDMTMLGSRGQRQEPAGAMESGSGDWGGGGESAGPAASGGETFPQGNGRKAATAVEAPQVINLDQLDDDQFF